MCPMQTVPNANCIPSAHVGARIGSAMVHVWSAMVRVGSAMVRVGSASLFEYQHVGIGHANHLRWG